jgi:hypothetical protein
MYYNLMYILPWIHGYEDLRPNHLLRILSIVKNVET